MSYSLVWFKRDLRWQDHEALAQAAKLGAVRCIYVVEPELWMQADAALQHFEFVRESLQDLDAHLRTLGGCIEIHTGEVPDVLQKIWQVAPFSRLYAHEETGNALTYARDLKVAAWCQAHSVHWQEFAQFFECAQHWLSRRHFLAIVCARCLLSSFGLFGLWLHQHARSGAADTGPHGQFAATSQSSPSGFERLCESFVLALPFHSKTRKRACH
jgi:hypothetical protein